MTRATSPARSPTPTEPRGRRIPFLAAPRTSVGNQGAVMSYGGSMAALLKVTDQFEARLRVMFQNTEDHGFPATFAPLPVLYARTTRSIARFDVQPARHRSSGHCPRST